MEKHSDKELMKCIIQGDTLAFKVLYKRYELRIYNFILRYTGSRGTAQDLLQETFTRLWLKAHTYDQRSGHFKSWIYKIALNIIRNEMAKKRYKHHYTDLDEISGGDQDPGHRDREHPEMKIEHSELRDIISNAMDNLKPFLREVVIMKNYQQLKFREIAEILDTPEGTIKARYHRAIAQLKDQLKSMEL